MSHRGTIAAALLVTAGALGIAQANGPSPESAPPAPAPQNALPSAGVPVAPAPAPASAPPPAAVVDSARIVALLPNKIGAPTFVGKSGELYVPREELKWHRTGAGGVSTDVISIFRTPAPGLFAVGSRAPLFRYDDGVWSAFHLGNRGRSAVSPGRMSVISVGRHIYELSKGSWLRIASARGAVGALYAAKANQIYVATTSGKLYVGRKGWRQLPLSLPDGDQIRTIVGLPNKHTVALSKENRLYLLTGKGAKLMALGAQYRGLEVHTIEVAGGKLMLAGRVGTGAAQKTILAELGSQKLAATEPLWAIAPDDRFAVIYSDHKQRIVVVTEKGQVRVKSSDGAWQNGEVDIAPPPPPEDFSRLGPALAK